ncbi:MAG: hypothetical protein K2P81_17890 [Bacteriovoracaceae bacterium]|nr:hypothetical protein [Bacteriovoracaceae bacterium]
MKLIALLFIASTALASEVKWKDVPEASKLAEQGFIFAALDAQIRFLSTQKDYESSDLELLEELVLKTSVEALEDYDRKVLAKLPIGSVQFLLGRESWREKNTAQAQKWLVNVPRWHRYYPEARFLMADMASDAGNVSSRESYQAQCVEAAATRAGEVNSALLKRYYTVLAEDCLTLEARKLYKIGKFQEAIEAYGKISKRAYKWPFLLLEKAWSYYNLKDYNRSLGLLVTYKAPLMESYFLPEAEVLTALGYFRLCLYDDALVVIDQFYTNYKPRTETLEATLNAQKSSQTYFYELMALSAKERNRLHPFIGQLATQIGQRPRFALDQASLAKVKEESNRLAQVFENLSSKDKARRWMKESMAQLKAVEENLVGRINYHAKKDMFAFIQDVYSLSEELFKVKLEIISRKKDLVYGSKKLISDRGRGSFGQVKRSRFEAFWKFHGAFWADELGDFSFGLASNCSTVRKEEVISE